MRRIFAAAGACALSLTAALADKPKSPPAAEVEPIARLVEKLGGRDYRIREAAARVLETRGVEALPELRKALESATSAETRRRLQSMVQNLERTQTLAPKRVTLKLKDRPVAEAVREISRQTGYAIQYQGNNNVSVTVEKDNVTFWEAMDFVCASAGLTMYYNENQGLVLYNNEGIWPHVNYQGPFKIVANSFNYNKSITLGPIQRNPAQNQLRSETLAFAFNVNSEPKLPLMGMGQPRILEAVDDLGNSMKVESGVHEVNHAPNYNGYRQYQYGTQLNLAWPNKEARLVKRLRVSLPVTLLSEQRPEVVVDDILKVKNKKFAGGSVELQIDKVDEQNNKTQYHLKMSVRNTASNAAQDYSWTNSVHQRVELLDAKGNKYFSHGYNWENSSPGHVQATFMFGNNGNPALGPPARLVYNHWSLMQHTIEFEFKDLQLP